MGSNDQRRRVFVPQALGADEFLRVTWHESRRVMVFSQWTGDRCTAAIPVRVDDVGDVASLLHDAVGSGSQSRPMAWPPPSPTDLVVPGGGFSLPAGRRTA